jgi:hypothetical protein
MKKKLIITESQLQRLKVTLTENNAHAIMVKRIKEDLDTNYEPVEKFVKEGGEYSSVPMFMIKIDEEVITAEKLFEYLKTKHKVGDEFLGQVIKDWVDKKISDDYSLSKNIPLS